ncbi:hypothetical protein ARMGADRAFT_986617 [Armillaria gallica]|uniref:Carbohydrate-binding module family 19 domain-containing protein n=1 Tax=Armillaria gallica TaxID=47427 RepID=A0A2H3E6B6_ARMGA|nr:hypothetical protein ARMGADRAFT_986617 [Armillaria gallica]
MLSSILFVSALFFSSRGAPTASLDASALLANGQAAQSQNVAFQNLSVNDTCSTGEVACISSEVAQCADNQWATSPCSGSSQCFALPSVRGNGTFLQCTSEKDATSVIDATGATGGIFGNGTDTSNSTTSGNSTDGNSTDTTSGTSIDDSGIVTVTVTLTPTATVFVSTEVPVTTTLSPDQASSLLASLTGVAGGSVITVSPAASATDAEVATTAVSSSAAIISLVPAAAATS